MKIKQYFILLLLLGFSLFGKAQPLQVSGTPPAFPGAPVYYAQMLQQLFGSGVQISNLVVVGDTITPLNIGTATGPQMGWFNGNGTSLGLTTGLLLTSGSIYWAVGPNNNGGASTSLLTAGDVNLDALTTAGTNDACVLEFDLIPYCDTIAIRYVFGSEEYLEWVGSTFNDVFGFFVSGPNPAGGFYVNQNIATIPGTSTPVTINNVNATTNSQYYVDNGDGSAFSTTPNNPNLQYDGTTVPLYAIAAVVPCQTYHIKIAVADAGDWSLDSGVFLEAGGISCSGPILNITSGSNLGGGGNITVEGCANGYFTFSIPQANTTNETFTYTIGGTANVGSDYAPFPSQVTIPAGQTTVQMPVTIFSDGISEGPETILLIHTDSLVCGGVILVDTIELVILDEPVADAGPDVTFCSGQSQTLGATGITGISYSWDPPTGLSGAGLIANPVATLTNNTNAPITYTYIVSSYIPNSGCETKDTMLLTVYPQLISNFTATNVCEGLPTAFTDASQGTPIQSWNWNFANLGTSTLQNPSFVFPSSGNYSVSLVVALGPGCTDTMTQNINVLAKPNVQITTNAPVCDGTPVLFTNATSASTVNWNWNFGDAQGSLAQNPPHLYNTSGIYNVSLQVVGANGCANTGYDTLQVYKNPTADFSTPGACEVDSVHFTANCLLGDGNTLGYSWNFGSLPNSTSQNPVHLFPADGNFPVTLYLSDNNGCADTITKNIEVFPQPIVSYTFNNNICEGAYVSFVSTSTVAAPGNFTTYNWSFGDGSTDVGTNQNPIHQYINGSTYNPVLIATTNKGCVDTFSTPLTVFQLPDITFTAPAVCHKTPTYFLNTTPNTTAWVWNFGGEGTSTSQNPTFTFNNAQTYNVTLTATDNHQCVNDTTLPVVVYTNPTADFSTPGACIVDALQFTNLSTVGSAPLSTYSWGFGDGGYAAIENPAHYFSTFNTYNVILVINDANGCTDTIVKPVNVFALPQPDFTVKDVCEKKVTFFEEQSTIASGSIVAYSWNFGDGNTAPFQYPYYTYNTYGIYPVTLTVTSDKGCVNTYQDFIRIYPSPKANFSVPNVCYLDTSRLSNLSTIDSLAVMNDSLAHFEWSFGDGFTTVLTNPNYVYSNPGYYTIKLVAMSDKGCRDSLSKNITIYPPATPPIPQNDTLCSGGNVTLIAGSEPGKKVYWYYHESDTTAFHIGNTLQLNNVTGTTTYYIETFTEKGCSSGKLPVSAEIHPPVNSYILASDSVLELPKAIFHFNPLINVPVKTYTWDFGDGLNSKASTASASHEYMYPDRYVVTLTTEDIFGCFSKAIKNIEVLQVITLTVPNAFSPNGDNINDELFVGYYNVTDLEFSVYDRWGQIVFTSNDPAFRWDGRDMKGKTLPEGAYMYKAKGKSYNGKDILQSGTITIIR